MITDVYSNKNTTLIIRRHSIDLKYFGATYSADLGNDIIETLADILNSISDNTRNIYSELCVLLNIMEPPPNKTLKFDGIKYIAC